MITTTYGNLRVDWKRRKKWLKTRHASFKLKLQATRSLDYRLEPKRFFSFYLSFFLFISRKEKLLRMNNKKTNKNHINNFSKIPREQILLTLIHLSVIYSVIYLYSIHLFGFVFLIWSKWISLKLKLHQFYSIFFFFFFSMSTGWLFNKRNIQNAFKLQLKSHSFFFSTEWNKIMGCEDYHALKRYIINEHTHK